MIYVGSCLDILPTLPADHFDSVVTDPPYHLTTGKKGGTGEASDNPNSPAGRSRIGTGFMGMVWDGGDVAMRPETWAAVLRVAKPGAYLAAFGGTRTFHRMMVAIEDAGWEIRDTLMWVYGSGFPKSHNGPWGGTALKPAWEPIVLARKPLKGTVAKNFAKHGTGGLNIDGCRVDGMADRPGTTPRSDGARNSMAGNLPRQDYEPHAEGRWPANVLHDGSEDVLAAFPDAPGQQGDLTGEEPSRPFKHAYGGMTGRRVFKARRDGEPSADRRYTEEGGTNFSPLPGMRRDPTSAARFFYCAKASREDRNEGLEGMRVFRAGERAEGSAGLATAYAGTRTEGQNIHPTVKPTDLMRWLCRLVTPPGGTVLDPFTGSGSTGRGAIAEGFQFVGIELLPEYAAIAEARIRAVQPGLPLGVVA